MATLKFTAAQGATNVVTLSVVDSVGDPVDLTALGATSVTAEICCGIYAGDPQTIDVPFSGSTLSPVFGEFNVKPGTYYPKIYYAAPGTDEEVIAGKGWATEIKLIMGC